MLNKQISKNKFQITKIKNQKSNNNPQIPSTSRLFLPTANCQLPTFSSRLMPHAFSCQLSYWRLPTAYFFLTPHASRLLPASLMPSSANWRLPTSSTPLMPFPANCLLLPHPSRLMPSSSFLLTH